MSATERGGVPPADAPAQELAGDPRALSILTAEHSSLASTRALAYNEAFTRAGMFLTSLAMSFVGLALLAQVLPVVRELLVIVAIVIGFDFIIGVLTYIRVAGTGVDDLKAMQGMNQIRQAYVRIAPSTERFFVTGTNDDVPSVMRSYGYDDQPEQSRAITQVLYGLSTSLGMVGVVMALVGGVEAAVIAALLGLESWLVLLIGAVATVVVFVVAARWTVVSVAAVHGGLEVRFPTGDGTPDRPRRDS